MGWHPASPGGKLGLVRQTEAENVFFFVWLLHGSTKVVVRAVALLSAKTK